MAAMIQAEMNRADVEADGKPIDLSDKFLSGLDLCQLNLKGVNLRTTCLSRDSIRQKITSIFMSMRSVARLESANMRISSLQ
jgi:uncharacterized protein YjbI with pentapeptide repeats